MVQQLLTRLVKVTAVCLVDKSERAIGLEATDEFGLILHNGTITRLARLQRFFGCFARRDVIAIGACGFQRVGRERISPELAYYSQRSGRRSGVVQ